MAETAIYLALRKIGIALGREKSTSDLGQEQGGRPTVGAGFFHIFLNAFSKAMSETISEELLVIRQAELQGRLRRIESELRMIHCFLAQMETRYNNKQVLQSWIGEARKLGCLVEQTMDEYIVRIIQRQGEGVGKRLLDVPSFALASHRLSAQLKEIEVELEHLSKMKKRWVQVDTETPLLIWPSIHPAPATSELTELYDKRKEELITMLNSGGRDHSVIAVCGKHGSGKTHLVRDVYLSVRKNFDRAAWISSSQCASTDHVVLIRTMQEQWMKGDAVTESATVEGSVRSLMEGLKNKKFLFVIDDVREPAVVYKARHPSFNNGMGSRTIIITPKLGVASESDRMVEAESQTRSSSSEPAGPLVSGKKHVKKRSRTHQKPANLQNDHEPSSRCPAPKKLLGIHDMEVMELTYLHHDDAHSLFCTKAFGRSTVCPEQLRKETEEIISLCKWLPQAIVSIGASLYLKQKTQSVWNEMVQQICRIKESKSSLNDVQKILYVSYNNLPMHLKNCLLYCSIFPAGFLLLPERLVRLWAAEGFIEKQGSSQLEEIAEHYIMDLINWGFLEVVDKDELGKVASCRMPIVVHELAVSISQKEEFGAACHGVKLAEMDTNVRCLFISECPKDIRIVIDFPYLRTLVAGDSGPTHLPSLPASLPSKLKYSLPSKLKYLTVLELQGSPLEELPSDIGYRLFNLRYLGLRNTKVRWLPLSMRRLYSLQTLDLKWSSIKELPGWIGDLTRLRHLFADNLINRSQAEFLHLKSLKAPKGLMYLKELQTLETVHASASFEKNAAKLTQLKSLSVGNMEGRSCKTMFTSLSKLSSLSSLLVSASDEDEVLCFQALNADRLEKLVVRGKLADQTFQCSVFKSENLKSLELSWCNLMEDSLKLLSANLRSLVSLNLYRVSGITQLVFQTGDSFAKLRTLVLREIVKADKLDIPLGSLGSLEVLRVESLDQLKNIQDPNRIESIRDLYFPQLMALRRNEDAMISQI